MARGFGASESRASLKGSTGRALEKALKGIPEVPGVLLDNELKALEKTGIISVKDFLKESPENRENIAKAIQAGIRDFEKNGLTEDDISAEEKDPEAIIEQDRTDRIREMVLDALVENDQRKNPDNRGFGAAEENKSSKADSYTPQKYSLSSGGEVSISKESEKRFAKLPDNLKESVAAASLKTEFSESYQRPPGGWDANPLYKELNKVSSPKEKEKALDNFVARYAGPGKEQFKKFLSENSDLLAKNGDGVMKVYSDLVNQAIGRAQQAGAQRSGEVSLAVPGLRSSKYDDDSASLITVTAVNQGSGNSGFAIRVDTEHFKMVNSWRHYLD